MAHGTRPATTWSQGNYIGTDATGTIALGNGVDGVVIDDGATNNTIGGTTAAAGNVISGNVGDGVRIAGAGHRPATWWQGNFIGTDATGSHALGNADDGVAVDQRGVAGNTDRRDDRRRRATSSRATRHGVLIAGPGTTGNVVEGNFIGTDATGTHALGNGGDGVRSSTAGATGNTIGGTTAGARNVISGNAGIGVVHRRRGHRRTTSSRATSSAPTSPAPSPRQRRNGGS